ncbi:MAG: hypothetical protein ACI4MQ_07860 [Candidatus Coproplasma sp.]
MSSIDKYVEGEARSINPNVRVEKIGSHIYGYMNGTRIFSIADRYGYLDDTERSTIRDAIKAYEAEQAERERRERIRLENERIAALNALKSSIAGVKNRLLEAYNNAQRLCSQTDSSLNGVASVLNSLNSYNISAYFERGKTLKAKSESGKARLESRYRTSLSEVGRIERSISDGQSTEKCISQRNELRWINFNVSSADLPNAEIEQFKGEVLKLKEALTQVKLIETELNKVKRDGLAGSIAASALKEIKQYEIRSLEDVNALLLAVQNHLVEIQNASFQQQSKERSDQIELLNGILKSCSYCREYVINQNYEAVDNRVEIVKTASSVLGMYSELDTAAYTTCSREKIKEAYELTQSVLIGSASDVQTLEHLKRLQEEGAIYKRDDILQADNYADYLKKQKELIERGVSLEEIEAFNPIDYSKQLDRLNEQLLGLDVQEEVDKTRTSFIMAWKAMEDMGYRMLYHNMGGEGADALACEGVFVIPGCEGVVCQVVVSGTKVIRRIIGVERVNGMTTPIQRVLEVAKQLELDGEVEEFFNRYSEEGGGELTVLTDVYSDDENSEQAINDNGCFLLTEEGERCFDKLVKTDDAKAKEKWRSRVSTGQIQTTVEGKGTSRDMRDDRSKQAYDTLVHQRAKK